jgi:hypothetical protein
MIVTTDGRKEVSILSVTYSAGTTRGELLCVTEDSAWRVPITIGGVTQRMGASYIGALARLMAGAIVMDGADYLAMRDSLDSVGRVA